MCMCVFDGCLSAFLCLCVYVCVCRCRCVCVREREREREKVCVRVPGCIGGDRQKESEGEKEKGKCCVFV